MYSKNLICTMSKTFSVPDNHHQIQFISYCLMLGIFYLLFYFHFKKTPLSGYTIEKIYLTVWEPKLLSKFCMYIQEINWKENSTSHIFSCLQNYGYKSFLNKAGIFVDLQQHEAKIRKTY